MRMGDNAKRKKAKVVRTVTCEICGREFKYVSHGAGRPRYLCSPECRHEAILRTQKRSRERARIAAEKSDPRPAKAIRRKRRAASGSIVTSWRGAMVGGGGPSFDYWELW